jgi:hypothetical protein
MLPSSEYDLTNNEYVGAGTHRVIEGTVNFQNIEDYTPDGTRVAQKGGQFTDSIEMGPGRGATQIKAVDAVDDSGNIIKLMGPTTVITPFEYMRSQVEANTPNMLYVHKELEKQNEDIYYYEQRKRDISKEKAEVMTSGAIAKGSAEKPFEVNEDTELSGIKNDPNVFYTWPNGIKESGADIYKRENEPTKK